MGKGSSKPQGQIQENNNSPKKDEPINTVQEVKVEQKERVLTEVDKIFEKYGHHGIRTVLAKSDSKYQSLSYVKINDRCDELVKNIEDTGHQKINEYKAKSEEDFEEIVKGMEQNNEGIVKKTQARTRKTIRQLLGFDEQVAKYEDCRTLMKQKFEDERYELKKAIKEQTRRHQKVDINEGIPQYDNQSREMKVKIIEQAEEKYGKRWVEKQEEERELAKSGKGTLSTQIYQFDFSHNHRPKFEKIIPVKECEEKRAQIKKNFEESARDAFASQSICC